MERKDIVNVKMRKIAMKRVTVTLVFGVSVISARGQGFGNLDFESAQNLPGNPGAGVLLSVTDTLPDWTAYDGPNALANIYYVSNNVGGVSSPVELESGSLALSGDFSVGLYLGGSIGQTGLVPSDAESLEFEARGPGPGGSLGPNDLSVTLGGESLSLSALSEGTGYFVYGANIPADLDGQLEGLTFLIQSAAPNVLLDNIEFSTSSVPEPGEGALIGLGAVLVAIHRRRRRPGG